jgi:hypothetical protein
VLGVRDWGLAKARKMVLGVRGWGLVKAKTEASQFPALTLNT